MLPGESFLVRNQSVVGGSMFAVAAVVLLVRVCRQHAVLDRLRRRGAIVCFT